MGHMFYYGFGGLFKMFAMLICLFIPIALLVGFISAVVWVYKDANKRGMSPWIWTLIVLLVPSFIGFIIYFLARTSNNPTVIKCRTCGNSIEASSNVCPYCGNALKKTCPSCGRPVDNNWRNCPTCGTGLSEKTNNNNQNNN